MRAGSAHAHKRRTTQRAESVTCALRRCNPAMRLVNASLTLSVLAVSVNVTLDISRVTTSASGK